MVFIDKEKYSNSIGIYQIRNISTGCLYIGQTRRSFGERYRAHNTMLKNGRHNNKKLQNDYDKFGEGSFVFSVVDIVSDYLMLDDLEKSRIHEAMISGFVYNVAPGGNYSCKGKTFSDATREKMRLSSPHRSPDAKTISAAREYMKNRTVSNDTKRKLSDANMGSKSPVAQISEEDAAEIKKKIMSGLYIKDIAKMYSVSVQLINGIASGRSWAQVYVKGWDEYLLSKKKRHIFAPEEVHEVRRLLACGMNESEIARRFGCCSSKINGIHRGITFRNI